jgi:chromosome segregation ATPase
MTEGMEQYGSHSGQAHSLEAAASEFRSKVEDAASRLSGAAEQFVAMSEGLLAAVEEARQAAERAEAAQRSVEGLKEQMSRDYGNVSDLVRDLQQRIGALATLAQPLPATGSEPEPLHPEPQPINSGNNSPGESSW